MRSPARAEPGSRRRTCRRPAPPHRGSGRRRGPPASAGSPPLAPPPRGALRTQPSPCDVVTEVLTREIYVFFALRPRKDSMATATSNYKVADIDLADFGRKEIALAEVEMPGLMQIGRASCRERA